MMNLPDFDFSLESIAGAGQTAQLESARALAAAGCDLVASTGTPFAWAGTNSIEAARERRDRLQQAAGVPLLMAGIAVVDALDSLGSRRVGLACTYYSGTWKTNWRRFIESCGFEAVAHNFTDDGIMPANAPMSAEFWSPGPDRITDSVRNLRARVENLDAIVISGAGARTLGLAETLRDETGVAVFGSDTALYWAIAGELGLDCE